jgi:hypothetical protein
MSTSNPAVSGEPVLDVPADSFQEFVAKAVAHGTKEGEFSRSDRSQPILSVEVSDFEEFSGQAVTDREELHLLARRKPDTQLPGL